MTPATPAASRYVRRAALALAVYLALTIAVALWARGGPSAGAVLRCVAALAPGVPVLAAVVATGRYFAEEVDPLQRTIQVEALLWAVGVTFGVATVWGFLEPLAGAPHVPSYCAFLVFCSVVGSVQLARRLFPHV